MNRLKPSFFALSIIILFTFSAFKGDKDKLHKRHFTINITDGKKPKAIPDEIFFKDGKVYCGDFVSEKLEVKDQIKYEIKKDSTYKDDDVDIEYIEIFATTQLEKKEIFEFHCVIENFEAQGTMKLFKNDKEKRALEFSGPEKVKTKKK